MAKQIDRYERQVTPTPTPQVERTSLALDDGATVAQYGAGQLKSVSDLFFQMAERQQTINDASQFALLKAEYTNASNDMITEIQKSENYSNYINAYTEGAKGLIDTFYEKASGNPRVAREFNAWATMHNANKKVAVQGIMVDKMRQKARADVIMAVSEMRKTGIDPTQYATNVKGLMDAAGENFDPDQKAKMLTDDVNDYAYKWELARMQNAESGRYQWSMNERSQPYLEAGQIELLNGKWADVKRNTQNQIWTENYNKLYTDIFVNGKGYTKAQLEGKVKENEKSGYSELSGQHVTTLLNLQKQVVEARRLDGAWNSADNMVRANRQAEARGEVIPYDIKSFEDVFRRAGVHEAQIPNMAYGALKAGIADAGTLELLAMDPLLRNRNADKMAELREGIPTGATTNDKIRLAFSDGHITREQVYKIGDEMTRFNEGMKSLGIEHKEFLKRERNNLKTILGTMKSSLNFAETDINLHLALYDGIALANPKMTPDEIAVEVMKEAIVTSKRGNKEALMDEFVTKFNYINPGIVLPNAGLPVGKGNKPSIIDIMNAPLGEGVGF